MKFITYNEKFEVQLIHNMPFDSVNGLGKTEEELLQIGALVEDIPQVDVPNDKQIIYKYNQVDNTVTYELVDRQLTVEEQNAKDIKYLKKSDLEKNNAIDICLLATYDIYSLLEHTDNKNLLNESFSHNIANFLCLLIKRNLKKIEDVPDLYKEEVNKMLV